jgi:hypothetical protein
MARADARCQTELVNAIMARRRGGQWPAAIALLAPVTDARKALTGGARSPERLRESEGARADGWGRPVSGGEQRGAREGAGPRGPGEGGRGAREVAGPEVAQPGERKFFLFLFYFLFLISIFYFYFFYPLFF